MNPFEIVGISSIKTTAQTTIMPFGSITSGTTTFEPRDLGTYTKSTLSFGDPDDSFLIRGATKTADPLRASVSRVFQKDVTVGGQTVRKTCTVTLSVVCPPSDFTPTEIDNLAGDISTFITASTVTRLLMGER